MNNLIKSALHIEPGESKLVGFVFLQSFFIGIARLFTPTTASTLFISNYGADKLPFIYVAVSVILPLIGLASIQISKKVDSLKLWIGILCFLSAMLIVFRMLIAIPNAKWASILITIWIDIEWTFTNIVFWNMSNRLFNVRQAKRLFGLISTGDIVSAILGGLLTPIIVKFIGTPNLILISAGAHICALLNLIYISNAFKGLLNSNQQEQSLTEDKKDISNWDLLKNKYIISILSIIVFSYTTCYLVDFIFYTGIQKRFTNENDMASFLGVFYAIESIMNLFFSIFITSRWLKSFGIFGGLIGTPMGVGTIALILIISGSFNASLILTFWLLVLIKLFEGLFRVSINDISYYTLFQSLSSNVKERVQYLGDTFFGQIGGGIVGLSLIIIQRFSHISITYICVALFVIFVMWIIDAFLVHKGYLKSLSLSLTRRGLQGIDLSLNDSSSLNTLSNVLKNGTPKEIVYCLSLLDRFEYSYFEEILSTLLEHPDSKVREEVYKVYEKIGNKNAFDLLYSKTSTEKDESAFGFLLRAIGSISEGEAFDFIEPYMNSKSKEIRLGAIVSLIRYCGIEGAVAGGTVVSLLGNSSKEENRIFAAKLLGEIGISNYYRGLIPLLKDESILVRKHALESAGLLNNPKLWSYVIENIAVPQLRYISIKTLIKGGEAVLPILNDAYYKDGQSNEVKKCIVFIFGKISGTKSIKLLKDKLNEPNKDVLGNILYSLQLCNYNVSSDDEEKMESLLKQEVLYAINIIATIKDIESGNNIDLLKSSLIYEMHKTRERILYILSFIYPTNLIKDIWDNFNSNLSGKRAFAIELLDNTIKGERKRFLLPLFEDTNLDSIIEKLPSEFKPQLKGINERLIEICSAKETNYNSWIRSLGFYVGATNLIENIQEMIGNLSSDEDFLLKDTCNYLLSINDKNRSKTSIIERVQILKKANIFSEIPEEILVDIAKDTIDCMYGENEDIVKKGEEGDSMYIISEGAVRVNDDGKTIAELGVGDIFGELAVLVPEPRSATVTSIGPTKVLCLSKESVSMFIENRIDIARAIINVLCQRIRNMLVNKDSNREIKKEVEYSFLDSTPDITLLEKVIILKTSEIFADTDDNILADLATFTKIKTLKKGQILFRKGDIGTTMYIIVKGKMRVYNETGTIAELGKGSILGELSALSSESRTASASAIENTTLLSLEQKALYEVMWNQIEVVRNIIRVLVQRLRALL